LQALQRAVEARGGGGFRADAIVEIVRTIRARRVFPHSFQVIWKSAIS
jgi:hypothetical protein